MGRGHRPQSVADRLRAAARFRLWTSAETEMLVTMRMCDDATIADALNRTPGAVRRQRAVLGLERKPWGRDAEGMAQMRQRRRELARDRNDG